jgi:hypothetical protein
MNEGESNSNEVQNSNNKENGEEWNDVTLEYWVKQNNPWILLHYSIVPLFQNYPFKF